MAFSATIAGHADPDTEQKAADAIRAALAGLGADVIDTARGYFQHLGTVDLAPTPPDPAEVARKALADALALLRSGDAPVAVAALAGHILDAAAALETLAPAPDATPAPAPPVVDLAPIQPGGPLDEMHWTGLPAPAAPVVDVAPAPVDPAPAHVDNVAL